MSKQTAIALVTAFQAQTDPGVWKQISRSTFASGLIERINNPDKIAQKGTPYCGPSSLWRCIAINNPDGFAQAAIDLYNTGKASVGTLAVKPAQKVLDSAPEGNTSAIDWVLLAGLRDTYNSTFSAAGWFSGGTAGITMPGTMADWFRKAGFSHISNSTHLTQPLPMIGSGEAHTASTLFTQGHYVALFIDSDMLESKSQDDWTSLYPDHWVSLASEITELNGNVSLKVYSWGAVQTVPEKPEKPLKKSDFLHQFYGYVAAKA